jgi:hypothetical protein
MNRDNNADLLYKLWVITIRSNNGSKIPSAIMFLNSDKALCNNAKTKFSVIKITLERSSYRPLGLGGMWDDELFKFFIPLNNFLMGLWGSYVTRTKSLLIYIFLKKTANIDTRSFIIATRCFPKLTDQSEYVFHLFRVSYWSNFAFFSVSSGGGCIFRFNRKRVVVNNKRLSKQMRIDKTLMWVSYELQRTITT